MDVRKIKEEAANSIIEAVKFATVVGIIATDCGIGLSASLYLNIRDAMFHYKALCDYVESDNEHSVLKHYFSLHEHLLRGKKDAIIIQAQNVIEAIGEIMKQQDFNVLFGPDDVKKMQVYSHRIKAIILKIRIAGSDLSEEGGFSVQDTWQELTDYIIKIVQLCEEKNVSLF